MKLCKRSYATATGEVGGYDAKRDDGYDHVFCGFPRGHTGIHVAMIWFSDEDTPELAEDLADRAAAMASRADPGPTTSWKELKAEAGIA
jgi:hypothetical protein